MQKLLLPLIIVLSSLPALSYDFEVDGIYYNIVDGCCSVTYKDDSYNSYSGEVNIPSSVTYDNTTYPVTSIGKSAFRACEELTGVTIPNSVTSIGDSAFCWCTGLTSIIIPDSVTEMRYEAFSYCKGLTSFTIPNSVTVISSTLLCGCTGLTSVTIPDSVTEIGSNSFTNCTGLTSITIPDSVETIYNIAFYKCSGLTSVTLSSSVRYIGENIFLDCPNLTSFTYLAEEPLNCEAGTFSNVVYDKCTLYYLESAKAKIDSTVPWSLFAKHSPYNPNAVDEIYKSDVAPEIIYDINGRRLSAPSRGINIINGHKTLIR